LLFYSITRIGAFRWEKRKFDRLFFFLHAHSMDCFRVLPVILKDVVTLTGLVGLGAVEGGGSCCTTTLLTPARAVTKMPHIFQCRHKRDVGYIGHCLLGIPATHCLLPQRSHTTCAPSCWPAGVFSIWARDLLQRGPGRNPKNGHSR
jgi:hypothetical protein